MGQMALHVNVSSSIREYCHFFLKAFHVPQKRKKSVVLQMYQRDHADYRSFQLRHL